MAEPLPDPTDVATGTPDAIARPPARRQIGGWLIAAMALAFAIGLVGSPWLETWFRPPAPPTPAPAAGPEIGTIAALSARVAALEAERKAPAQDPAAAPAGLAARVAALEAEAAALRAADAGLGDDLGGVRREALAGTQAVRDLLLIAVVRRMVELGRPLGPRQARLADRFGKEDRAAVEALAAWSLAPQTIGTLDARLAVLASAPVAPATAGWRAQLKAWFSGLITVREAGAGGRDDAGRDDGGQALARARAALASGDVALAAGQFARAPASVARDAWLGDARLLADALAALDRLEQRSLAATAAAAGPPAGLPGAAAAG